MIIFQYFIYHFIITKREDLPYIQSVRPIFVRYVWEFIFTNMKTNHRNQRILQILDQTGELSVDEACAHFGISPATARRAFTQLVEEGRAQKTWGGIQKDEETFKNPGLFTPTSWRFDTHRLEKIAIANEANERISDGMIVFMDGGTTTYHLGVLLARRPVRIVTNSLLIASEIDRLRPDSNGAEVFMTGGYLYPRSAQLVGPEAVASIHRFRATIAFLSVGGILEDGAYNNNDLVVEIERSMMVNADQTYLLADSSKFGQREMVRECTWDECDGVITNKANLGTQPPDNKLIIARNNTPAG